MWCLSTMRRFVEAMAAHRANPNDTIPWETLRRELLHGD